MGAQPASYGPSGRRRRADADAPLHAWRRAVPGQERASQIPRGICHLQGSQRVRGGR